MVRETARFCPQCGARLQGQAHGRTFGQILWGLALGFAALLLGGLGTCFLIAGLGSLRSGLPGLVWAAVMLLVAASAFAGMIKVVR
jgi:hypothetical protein